MTYESMTPKCGRSVVQVLVVRVDIGVVTYEAMTPQCGGQWFRYWLSKAVMVGHFSLMCLIVYIIVTSMSRVIVFLNLRICFLVAIFSDRWHHWCLDAKIGLFGSILISETNRPISIV